jgi:hypothetical protein
MSSFGMDGILRISPVLTRDTDAWDGPAESVSRQTLSSKRGLAHAVGVPTYPPAAVNGSAMDW